MEKSKLPLIDALPAKLVTAERFQQSAMLGWGGEVALASVVELRPEVASIIA